jgi:hypothetical protein
MKKKSVLAVRPSPAQIFAANRAEGRKLFNRLYASEKHALSDKMVRGSFSWRDCLEEYPGPGWETGMGDAHDFWAA